MQKKLATCLGYSIFVSFICLDVDTEKAEVTENGRPTLMDIINDNIFYYFHYWRDLNKGWELLHSALDHGRFYSILLIINFTHLHHFLKGYKWFASKGNVCRPLDLRLQHKFRLLPAIYFIHLISVGNSILQPLG